MIIYPLSLVCFDSKPKRYKYSYFPCEHTQLRILWKMKYWKQWHCVVTGRIYCYFIGSNVTPCDNVNITNLLCKPCPNRQDTAVMSDRDITFADVDQQTTHSCAYHSVQNGVGALIGQSIAHAFPSRDKWPTDLKSTCVQALVDTE